MVATVGSIQVLLSTNYGPAIAGMRQFGNSVEREGGRAQRTVAGIDRTTIGMNRTMRSVNGRSFQVMALSALRSKNSIDRLSLGITSLTTLLGGLGTALTIQGIKDYADTYTTIENRLGVVKRETASVVGLQNELFSVADRSRSQYESTAVLFSRIEQSAKRLNISQKDTMRATETIQKAFVVGGSTTVEAAQSAIQLSQGIASNRLQGDELRSILENPALGGLLAEQISGGDIGALRKMAEEGELTAKTVVTAFVEASAEIDRLFEGTEQTVSQALVRLDNAIMRTIGESGAVETGTRASITAIVALADNIDFVIARLTEVGVVAAAALAGRGALGGAGVVKGLVNQQKEMLKAAETAKQLAAVEVTSAKQARQATLDSYFRRRSAMLEMQATGAFTAKQLETQSKKVTQAEIAHRQAVEALRNAKIQDAAASRNVAAATAAMTAQTRAATVAKRAFAGALGLIGGVPGAVFLALGAAMLVSARNAQAAQEVTGRYADVVERAGNESSGAADKIRDLARAQSEQAAAAQSYTDRLNDSKQASSDFESQIERMEAKVATFNLVLSRAGFGSFSAEAINATAKARDLISSFEAGEISAEDFADAMDAITRSTPDLSGVNAEVIQAARTADAARGAFEGLAQAISSVAGGKVGKVSRADVFNLDDDQRSALIEGMQKSTEDFEKVRAEAASKTKLGARMFGVDYDPDKSKRGGSGRAGGKSEAQKQAEDFEKAMSKLRLEVAAFDLSEFDQKVLQAGQSLNMTEAELMQFINAAQGNGEAPARLASIRQEMEKISALEFGKKLDELRLEGQTMMMSEFDQKVISTARSFDVAESSIQQFIAASKGLAEVPPEISAISVELQKIEQNQKLLDFADGAASAFGGFFDSIASGSGDADDALKQLALSLAKLVAELLIIQPLMNSIRGGIGGGNLLGSLLGGGAGAFPAAPLPISGLYANGGDIGRARGAIRHEDVLIAAQETEAVFNQRQMGSVVSALNGQSNGGAQGVVLNVTNTFDGETIRTTVRDEAGKIVAQNNAAIQKQMPKMVHAANKSNQQRGRR